MSKVLRLVPAVKEGIELIRDECARIAEYPDDDLYGAILILPCRREIIHASSDHAAVIGQLDIAQHVLADIAITEEQ